jgi:hypothetical protein
MSDLQTKLKTVPAINKQELFFYIIQHAPTTSLRIVMDAGLAYTGIVLNVGSARIDDAIVTFQISEPNGRLTNRVLHISIHKIESVELLGAENELINILSLGKASKNEAYEVSGKLEVNRALKSFSESILKATGVEAGVPDIVLPTDGLALNRVLKLTKKIELAIIELLKEKDAKLNWKEKYSKIAFVDAAHLEVMGNKKSVQRHFPFNDVNQSEISTKELTDKLMSIL